MAVMTSPAPFARATRVTPAIYSVILKYWAIKVIPLAKYSSTVAEINRKIIKIIKSPTGTKNSKFP